MKVAIMQPYLLPYLGYFQLAANVDKFVVYDDVQFTKKGWIHRNRFLMNGEAQYFSLPLKKDSDFLYVNQRCLAENWGKEKEKTIRRLEGAYRKAPYFDDVFPFAVSIFSFQTDNLWDFLKNSFDSVFERLRIKAEVLVSSEIEDTTSLNGQQRVIQICSLVGAKEYINPIGGVSLYSSANFQEYGISLRYLEMQDIVYEQFRGPFVPALSILDVMMFNSPERIQNWLESGFKLHE